MTVAAKSLNPFVSGRLMAGRGRKAAARLALVAAVAAPFSGCTSAQLQGQSSSYLIIDSIRGASGAEPDTLSTTFFSDVQTLVKREIDGKEVRVPTVYEDSGKVSFRLGMKDPTNPTGPTSANFITVNRYHVNYVRADGRNTPGVDVPYPFDSAFTATVNDTAKAVEAGLSLVRLQAKLEKPLLPLVGFGGALAISTIAEVTFYGKDQTGREVTVSGNIGVTFADWGDPD